MASQYPTAVDDQTSLYNPKDRYSTKLLQTTLGASCLSSDVTIQLAASPASLGMASAYGIVTIEDEKILYVGTSGNNLTGCVRGFGGSTAVGHTSGTAVYAIFVTDYIIALQNALIAVQAVLGVDGAYNFVSNPFTSDVDADGYGLGNASVVHAGSAVSATLANATAILLHAKASGFPVIACEGSHPLYVWLSNSNGTDANFWDVIVSGLVKSFRLINDAYSSVLTWMKVTRSGISSAAVEFPTGTTVALTAGPAVSEIVTTVGAVGSDSKLPTEQAVREAISPGVNAQTGTSYSFVDGDRGKLVTGTNASSQAYTLPQAGASSLFISGWFVDVENRGAGTLTITPTTSTIDGAASLALTQNQGCRIFSDGTNYFTQRGVGGGGGSSFSGASAYRSSNQSLSDATPTAVSFTGGEHFDTAAYHDTSTNPSRLTAPSTGYYEAILIGSISFITGSPHAMHCTLDIAVNGSVVRSFSQTIRSDGTSSSSTNFPLVVSAVLSLSAGDYVEFIATTNTQGTSHNFVNGITGQLIQK